MEWDLPGGVVRVQVEVQAEEVVALAGWAVTALEPAPAASVSALVVEPGCHIRQVSHVTI
jgi:hypothetical protein